MPSVPDRVVARLMGAALGLVILAWVVTGASLFAGLSVPVSLAVGADDVGAALGVSFACGAVAFTALASVLGHVRAPREGAWRVGLALGVPLLAAVGTGLSPLVAPTDALGAAGVALLGTTCLCGAALLAPRPRVAGDALDDEEATCPPS